LGISKLENERMRKWGGLRNSKGNGGNQKRVKTVFGGKRL